MPEPTLRTDAQRKGWAYAAANPDKATHPAISAAAGVSAGTVAKWLRSWRQELGDDLFRGPVAVERAKQTEAAREESDRTWLELSTNEARRCGAAASDVRDRLLEILPAVATTHVDRGTDGLQQPILVRGPDAREIKALADAVSTLIESAQLLVGSPTRHTRRSVPSDQWTPAGLPPGGDLPQAEKRAKILDLTSKLRDRQTG